ncbi:hypothetical protein BZA05DRAFT_15757 [Tricharina praecox]|uniref:uncharacterized protein n=1 Tax=Tricharina praecox TaxID=43433 RepID=UPI00221E70E5|nr:uncharacterized protein BZA05DRAFT_15757 [Tricharina praecox]KAI5858842.1 hypothetical protein BZA05DRAFT_15757 [Tricharina praecox]
MSLSTEKSEFFLQNTLILYAIGAVAAILRIIIRWRLMHRLGVEEWIMIFGLLCWTGDTALITVTVNKGTNQVPSDHRLTMSPHQVHEREIGSKSFITAWFLYVTAIWACKAAILMFYKRLTERVMEPKINIAAAGTLGSTYLACMLSLCFVCRPFSGNWTIFPDPGPACTEGLHYVWIVGVLNIITDLMLLCIPIPLLIHLQVTLTRKILLGALFGLGIFVVVATILRIYFTVVGGSISNMTFWSMIETSTLFVVSNAPGIKSFFTSKKKHSSSNGNSGSGLSRSHEMNSSIAHTHSTNNHNKSRVRNSITGNNGKSTSDSQEWIVDPQNPMVIHQSTRIDVTVEGASSDSTKDDKAPSYQVSAEARSHNSN